MYDGRYAGRMENNIFIPVHEKVYKKRWKTIKYLTYLMHVVKYSKMLNENSKEQARSSSWNEKTDSGKRSCIDPLFSMKLLGKN